MELLSNNNNNKINNTSANVNDCIDQRSIGMGHNSSRDSIATTVRKKFRWKPHRKRGNTDLSATFNVLDVNLHYEQLNINVATEEELMTLPGISRNVARNILEYRQTIGSFRKVEDLALVSGVGATKLELIRPEICVARRRINPSLSSSQDGSEESIPSSIISNNRNFKTGYCNKLVNINKANMFQLMSIRGIDQELAANIVHCREKRGPFRTLDDLVKVKGITNKTAGEFCQHMTVSVEAPAIEYIPRTPQQTTPQFTAENNQPNGGSGHHRRTRSMPPKCESPLSSFDISDLYNLLSAKSPRPIVTEMFNFRRNGKTGLRLATWNLQQFTLDKADNPGVREVICRTIWETGLSLVAIQELCDKEVLDKICAELNSPCIKKNQEWSGHHGTWECITSDAIGQTDNDSEYSGFLYDTSRGIDIKESKLLTLANKDNGLSMKKPFCAVFRIEQTEFVLMSVRIASPPMQDHNRNNNPTELAEKIGEMLTSVEKLKLNENLVILGDMNFSPIEQEFNSLRDKSFTHIVPVGTYTSVKPKSHQMPNACRGFDNVWLSKQIYKYFTGHWNIVRQGLSHLAIPHGWMWGGMVSSHCPVWVEFYIPSSTDSVPVVANGKVAG